MILIVDMNFKKASLGFYEFVLPIVTAIEGINSYIVKHYAELDPDELAEYDSVILSGTPLMDNATLTQLERFEWIKTCPKPMLGICAGMQTIASVFGSRLVKCLGIGMTDIVSLKESLLFSSAFKAYALHNFSIKPSRDFEILAKSARCVEAMKLQQRDVYGVLFHPEVRNPEILQHFANAFSPYRRV